MVLPGQEAGRLGPAGAADAGWNRTAGDSERKGHCPMTESEWNACADPQKMLDYLEDRGLLTDRKQRLVDCACVRRAWHLLLDGRSRRAVELAEEYADGLVSLDQLQGAQATALVAAEERLRTPACRALYAAAWTAWEFRHGVDP